MTRFGSASFGLRVILSLLLCLFARVRESEAQLSPGDLSTPHAALEGISNCGRCHEGEGKSSGERCLDCHGEIRAQHDTKAGFHWSGIGGEERHRCGRCHAEHNGREYELIYWEGGVDRFDHGRTGYSLAGKHRERRCRDCHRRERLVRELGLRHPDVNLDRTFLGLDRECAGCHEDVHLGQFPESCDRCHGPEGWRPADRFTHERSRYPLTGRHRPVPCGKCHREVISVESGVEPGVEAPRHVRYRGLRFDDCSGCHDYRHRTELGGSCASCHTTEGWRSVASNGFDHAKTRFPLRGRHRDARCEACHRDGERRAGLKFERCVACHRDIHLSGFRSDRYAGRCEACHGEDRFVPSTYGLNEHDRGPFPLEGAHRAIPCTACHERRAGEETVRFLLEASDCGSCHRDPHRGQFPAERYPGCPSCHDQDRWERLRFDHQATAFPLDGRHVDVRCAACHPPERTVDNERFVRYTPLDRSCRGCHAGEPGTFFRRGESD